MSCCTSILNLGCYQSCDPVQFGQQAMQTGDYIVETQPDNKRIFSTYNTAGNPLFVTNRLNEDGATVFRVVQPDGTYLTATTGEDCFQVTNSIAVDPTKADTTIDPITCLDATAVLKDTASATISTTLIASGASQNITAPDATYQNSDASFSQLIVSDGTFVAPDITDSDGVSTIPANTNCTVEKALQIKVFFADGTDTITCNGDLGTIASESTDGGSTFTYNTDTFAAWDKAWGADIDIVRSSSSGVEILTLTGTYT